MTTFVNQNREGTIIENGKRHLESRDEDFEFFSKYPTGEEDEFLEYLYDEQPDLDELEQAIKMYRDVGSFYEYGLNFDFVAAGTFNDQKEGFYRYQISYGGPSEEIRFYHDGTIEFVYLEWGSGVGFDVSGEDWAKWLRDQFADTGSIDWDSIPYEDRVNLDYEEE